MGTKAVGKYSSEVVASEMVRSADRNENGLRYFQKKIGRFLSMVCSANGSANILADV